MGDETMTQGGLSAPIRLATERLELLPFAREDLPALRALFHDPDVRRYLWDDELVSDETLSAVIEASLETFRTAGFGHWTLRPRGGSDVWGFCGLRRVEDGSDLEILYALHAPRWGAGLAREACRAVLRYAFERLGLARVAGRVDTPNAASIRVLEALAMAFEGDHPVNGRPTRHYGLSRAAWQQGAADNAPRA